MTDLRDALASHGQLLQEMYRAVEPAWPKEGCGFLFENPDGTLVVLPTVNRADLLHQKDPETYPRGAESWFEPDMKPWLRAAREGATPRMIYHSHPDVGAYFSDSDQDSAVLTLEDGTAAPRHPGVWHLVISVRKPGQADEAALFCFSPEEGRFTEQARFDADGRLR